MVPQGIARSCAIIDDPHHDEHVAVVGCSFATVDKGMAMDRNVSAGLACGPDQSSTRAKKTGSPTTGQWLVNGWSMAGPIFDWPILGAGWAQ